MNPFKMGIKAFREGTFGNPFEFNTQDHRDYEMGYNKAYFGNLRRQKEYERTIHQKGAKRKSAA